MSPETRQLQLTQRHTLTLTQITRFYFVTEISAADPEKKYESLKPAPVPGYTHEDALAHIESYRSDWLQYATKVNQSQMFIFFGVAWKRASLEMDDGCFESEQDGAIGLYKKMGLGPLPDRTDLVEMGALAYALIERLLGHQTRDELTDWLREGAGLLNQAQVESERKSPESDGEQPPAPGNNPGDAPKNQGRRKNARNRGG